MISDNTSNYKAAANKLKELLSLEEVHTALGHQGKTWKFILKKTPWFGDSGNN